MNAEHHYKEYLAPIYSWMAGDFRQQADQFASWLKERGIEAAAEATAIDLGCGHGIQSVAMAEMGFAVTAVDFNRQLLDELEEQAQGLTVKTQLADLNSLTEDQLPKSDLIICWGDTLTHLETAQHVDQLLKLCAQLLKPKGSLVLGFRDYSDEKTGSQRYVPVKHDAERVLSCLLYYLPNSVRVTDLIREWTEDGWEQRSNSYFKLRLAPKAIANQLSEAGLSVMLNEPQGRMQAIHAQKS